MIAPMLMAAFLATGTLEPIELRCEELTNPVAAPIEGRARVSWKLRAVKSGSKNLVQSAYRIRAGSRPGASDFYDSGRVASSAQYGVRLPALPAGKKVHWQVMVWDQDGNPGEWSRSATFGTGIAEWRAQWISIPAPDMETSPFAGAQWIWGSGDRVEFSRRFSVSDAELAGAARLAITVDDSFTARLNGEPLVESDGRTDSWRRPRTVDIKGKLKSGTNELTISATNMANSPAGLVAAITVGSRRIVSDANWIANGGNPTVIGAFGIQPWGDIDGKTVRAATVYRKDFEAKRPVRATAYVSARGLADLYLNGRRVSEDLFTPGWTDYGKRLYYAAYDVTRKVRAGRNTIGTVLGDGWYSGYVGFSGRANYGERPQALVQLELEYSDGTRQVVASDGSWRASTGGTIGQDFLMGEAFDARREPKGWSSPGFDESSWRTPAVEALGSVTPTAYPGEPVRVYDRLRFKSSKEVRPGVYVLDYGQNMAGFARLRLRGKAGQKLTLRFAEAKNPDGTIYTANLRSARQTDTYTFAGDGVETWEPRFTFHGFQYIEVEGLDRAPRPEEFVALAISSATPEVGKIETSSAMINKLARNAWWTQKMNFIDVPTDCPQRDERLGWTGDAQAYISTAAYYSDVQSFFNKWLTDLSDSQQPNGQFPSVAPFMQEAGADGGPAWADAGTICPWTVYEVYGDRDRLERSYPSMVRYLNYLKTRSRPGPLPPERYHAFGDWLSINANTPNDVIFMAYLVHSADLAAKAAGVLGKGEDAREFSAFAQQGRESFRKNFVDASGRVRGETQCAYVLALAFDLVDGEQAKQAAAHLVRDIESRGWHLSTGFVGTRDIMYALTKIGRNDVAFRLLHNKTFPSWGFPIQNGATTIWERWDGWTPERGFQDAGMNSFAHYAYGSVMGWVYANIGGIQPAAPGYAAIRIAPAIDPNLTFAKTEYDSVRGKVRVEWRKRGDKVDLTVEVPPNATAEVHVPGGEVRRVGSGSYRFEGQLR